jgi:hypothetical protein
MTSKKFLLLVSILTLVFVVLFASINYQIDQFGLWGRVQGLRILSYEKTSKYLMAHRYIPENFNALLIGASVSDNVDTSQFKSLKMYNLSMNGGNISEIREATKKVFENSPPQLLLICLHPYIVKDSGIKGSQISTKEYYGSLFSLLPLKMLKEWVKINWLGRPDKYRGSEYGAYYFERFYSGPALDVALKRRKKQGGSGIKIDPKAREHLGDVVSLARENNTRIVAFYYPIYEKWNREQKVTGDWDRFKDSMGRLFEEHEKVVDLNAPRYAKFTGDPSNYTDGHLSRKGADHLAKLLESIIEDNH